MEGEECLTEVQRNLKKQPQTINVNDNKNGNKDPSDRVQTVDSRKLRATWTTSTNQETD